MSEEREQGVVASPMDELLDRAPCGFVSFGDDGVITAVNTTLAGRLRHEREALVGRHVETLFTIPGRLFYQTHFFPLLRLQGRAQEIFLLLRAADGEQVGVLCNAVRHERGGAAAYDCILVEVQERRKFEEALIHARQAAEQANALLEEQAVELELQHQQLQEQAVEMEAQQAELDRQRRAADEANQAKTIFLATMSHELRTPLNAIGGYVQLLELGIHGPITDTQRETLGRIARSQQHLLRLINNVLSLSRIEAGHVDYVIERFELADLMNNVLPMVEPQALARELRLEVAIPPQLAVRADREKTHQILLNLLSNAVKFTPARGSIRVEAGPDAGASPAVAIRVADTGRGIPADQLEKVFEPFVQVHASRHRAAEGTGLGLAISRDLARGMGGDLSATSTVDVGSTFTLTLPSA